MCESSEVMVIKSNSAAELLANNEMTLLPDSNNIQSTIELSKLKRTFTLPRNPFNSTRMSKRKINNNKTKETNNSNSNNEIEMKTLNNNSNSNTNENNRKVFRRPSIRRFINKIAQHIGGVPVITQNDNNRVPPVGGLQTWGPDDTPGVTGLKNHGNTCFINAVLQCISHTDVLAEYFVLDRYKIDLSKRNKLNSKKFGTKGEVTEQLALLLKALWACQYSPEFSTNFKQIVERHGSQYKGNQQHDALEFLQWLLDKVHEDLNTASKRKYKSIKTSGRPDEVIAAETLENYKRCNNSFIQGIFQAQYRSSLSCSRCRTQSNTFDPFQCISVQLPQFHKHSIFVTVLYTSQQPRQVQIGLSMPSGATISELRDILESDTSIERANMLITEIGESSFLRNFTDTQSITIITEIDSIYCIEVAQLKDIVEDDCTSAYILLCWINVIINNNNNNEEKRNGGGRGYCCERFGSPYTMQVSRETSYDDLQKLVLKEMAPILHDDILTNSQPRGIFKMRISDPACNDNEPPCYLEPDLEHPLFMEAIDQALALCSEEGGPPHVKLVMEFTPKAKSIIIADDLDIIEEHSSVKLLRTQALQGGAPLTLEECLRDYTEAETLTDAWRCPFCQQYQPVIKTLDVWSLPDILVVHFKRFRQQSLRGCNSSTKLTTMVDFPVDNFDMSPHLAVKNNSNLNHHHHNHNTVVSADDSHIILSGGGGGGGGGGNNGSSGGGNGNGNGWSPWKRAAARKQSNTNDNIYDLYGICYHHGSDLETGHYTAACKNPYDNQWYLYDDAKVTNLSKQTDDINSLLVNNSAYILFYQKRNGFYIGSSSNSNSSAASTSSVGSITNNDHWVSKMAKFQPPKNLKVIEKKDSNIKQQEEENNETINNKEADNNVVLRNNSNEVAFKNSQNTLHSSNGSFKKCNNETKSITTNNIIVMENNIENHSTTTTTTTTAALSRLSLISNSRNSTEIKKPPPIYTTSIYINSSGNAEITTTACDKSPVLSLHRVSGVLQDDENIYTTTASVHRCSDINNKSWIENGVTKTHLNWMSPQPTRKLNQSQQSV